MKSFFSSGYSKAINEANKNHLPNQVKKNEDEHKKKQQKK